MSTFEEITRRVRGMVEAPANTPTALLGEKDFWKTHAESLAEALRLERAKIATLEKERAAMNKQIAFLDRVVDRQRGPARVAHCGVPKKTQGPLNMRLLIVSREEAALLVPGVKCDSTGTVGSFEWGADSVEVHVRSDKACEPEKGEDW